MARLVYRDRDGREQSVNIDARSPRIYVGRNPDCDIQTTRPSVSRKHSEFSYANGVVTVRDLNSSNGTFVNGREIQQETISESDDVKCGDFAIRLVLDESDRAPTPRPPSGSYGRPVGRPGIQRPGMGGRPGVQTPASSVGAPARPGRPGVSGRPGVQTPASPSSSSSHAAPPTPPPVSQPISGISRAVGADRTALNPPISGVSVAEAPTALGVNTGLQSEVKRLKEENEQLRREKIEMRNELEDAQRRATRADRVDDLERELDRKQTTIDSLQDILDENNEKTEEQLKKLTEARKDVQNKRERIEELVRDLETTEKALDKLRGQQEEMREDNANLKVRINQLERQLSESSRNTKLANHEHLKLQTENEELRAMLEQQGSEASDAFTELGQLRQVIDAKELELEDRIALMDEMQRELDAYRAGDDVGFEERERLREELSASRESLQRLQDTIEEMEANPKIDPALLEELDTLRKGRDDDAIQLERVRGELSFVEAELKEARAAAAAAAEVAAPDAAAGADLDAAAGAVVEGAASGGVDQEEYDRLRARNKELERELDILQDEVSALRATAAPDAPTGEEGGAGDFTADAMGADATDSDAVASLRRELEIERERSASLMRENDNLQAQITDLRDDLNALHNAASASAALHAAPDATSDEGDAPDAGREEELEAEIASLRQENARMSSQINALQDQLDASPVGGEDVTIDGGEALGVTPGGMSDDDQQELERLRKANQRLEKDNERMFNEVGLLDDQIEELRQQLDEARGGGDVAPAAASGGVDQEEYDRLRARNKELGRELDILQDEVAALRTAPAPEPPASEGSGAEIAVLREEIAALALKVDQQASEVQGSLDALGGHIGTVRRIYEAIRKADLQKLSTLDRIRIEKTIRDLGIDPDEVFDEIERLTHECAERSGSLTEAAATITEAHQE